MQQCKLICCTLSQFDISLWFASWREVRLIAIGPRYLFDQHPHMLWQAIGRTSQGDPQPVTHFLADGGTPNNVDVRIAANGWAGHENSPVIRGQH